MMQNLTELKKKKKTVIRLRDVHTPDRRGRQKNQYRQSVTSSCVV